MLKWSYVETERSQTIFVVDDETGETHTLPRTHPNFLEVRAMLSRTRGDFDPIDARTFRRLIAPDMHTEGLTWDGKNYSLGGEKLKDVEVNTLLALDAILNEHDQ